MLCTFTWTISATSVSSNLHDLKRICLHVCAGNPKGVVLTHKNVLATVAALQTFVREVGLNLSSDDSTLSYLTLAHILGRALEEFALSVGASIGYWQVRPGVWLYSRCH